MTVTNPLELRSRATRWNAVTRAGISAGDKISTSIKTTIKIERSIV